MPRSEHTRVTHDRWVIVLERKDGLLVYGPNENQTYRTSEAALHDAEAAFPGERFEVQRVKGILDSPNGATN